MTKMKIYLGIALFLSCFIGVWAIVYYPNPSANKPIMNISYNDYAELWAKVQELENQGLTESAKGEVKEIYKRAKKDHNHPQLIKSLFHLYKYSQYNEEDDDAKLITGMEQEIASAEQPLKSILQSVYGEILFNYFNQNRYTIMQRTAIQAVETDIRTWDMQKLMGKSKELYLASIADKAALRKLAIRDFRDILYTQENSEKYRPTLYDFLAHRAINFMRSGYADVTKAADQFKLNSEADYGTTKEFIKHQYVNTDSLSLNYYAIELLQEIEAYHEQLQDRNLVINTALYRLGLVHELSVIENKDSLYRSSLRQLAERAADSDVYPRVAYQLANHLYYNGNARPIPFNKGRGRGIRQAYPSGDNKNPADVKEALDLCNKAIERYPKEQDTENCRALKLEILRPELLATIEEAAIPNQPILAQIAYRNIDKLFYRIYVLDHWKYMDELQHYRSQEQLYEWVKGQELVESGIAELRNDEGHIAHRTEIKLPSLKPAFYIVVVSEENTFERGNYNAQYMPLQVTDISVLSQPENGNNVSFVRSRTNGAPIQQATVTVYNQVNYNNTQYSKQWVVVNTLTTDASGMFRIDKPNGRYNSYLYKITKGSDTYFQSNYLYEHYESEDPGNRVDYLYTDRAIYRPGQKLFFKGIATYQRSSSIALMKDQTVSITLRDANYQEVETKQFSINEYGSFSGEFQLPTGLLTGNFTLGTNFGSLSISVEEYKRPKFLVKVEKPTAEIAIDEEVEVRGTATSFAGVPITDSKVTYRVIRVARYPYIPWYCRYYPWQPPSSEMEIVHGESVTDAKGSYKLKFKTIPDLSLDRNWNPVFDYKVIVDVTDLNGETRTGEVIVSAGYESAYLQVSANALIWDKEGLDIMLGATTANGFTIPTTCKVEMMPLKAPNKAYRQRSWSWPDTLSMDCEEYAKSFNMYDCEDRSNPLAWERGAVLISKEIKTDKENDSLHLAITEQWKAGTYLLRVTAKNKSGAEMEELRIVEILNTQAEPKQGNDWFYSYEIPTTEPNPSSISFLIGSPLTVGIEVIYQVQINNEILKREKIELLNNQRVITYELPKNFEGQVFTSFTAIYQNSYKDIPITKIIYPLVDELEIEVMSYREKIQPNDEEQWVLKIKNSKDQPVLAELLTAMYDASLDQFVPHSWNTIAKPYKYYYNKLGINISGFGHAQVSQVSNYNYTAGSYNQSYDELNWFGFYPFSHSMNYGVVAMEMSINESMAPGGNQVQSRQSIKRSAPPPAPMSGAAMKGEAADMDATSMKSVPLMDAALPTSASQASVPAPPKGTIRTNLNETAFFMPQILTDKDGNITIRFKAPEALTTWKWMGLAHDKNARSAFFTKEIVTQKDLMVFPNVPRYFRESDEIVFSTKVSNLGEKDITGTVRLELLDATSGERIDARFDHKDITKNIALPKGANKAEEWRLKIPSGLDMVTCRIIAQSGAKADGEEHTLPILSNRMLVTETLPLPSRGKGTKNFSFDKLKNYQSTTLRNHSLTIEYTPNPIWYAIQALPYLMEYPHQCNEQVFNRYFANALSTHLAHTHPSIEKVFEQWKNGSQKDKDALLSNLEKNQELKSILLEESPWVRAAQDESERKHRLAFLFDVKRMNNEAAESLKKLFERQGPEGAWSWFEGMYPSRYITQYIVTGFGRLMHLGVIDKNNFEYYANLQKAISYLDDQANRDYHEFIKNTKEANHLSSYIIHYLYMRSFYLDIPIQENNREAHQYFFQQLDKYWLTTSRYDQALGALASHRYDQSPLATKIMRSLKENATYNEEMGMYYKDFSPGYYWNQAPIEAHSVILEAFDEIVHDTASVEGIKTWLLKQKQVQDWGTTIATADACYALLVTGLDWVANPQEVEIKLGGEKISFVDRNDETPQAGTGYVKTVFGADEIKSTMGDISVSKSGEQVAWGAAYWQYFENLDKITAAQSPLKINRKLYKVVLNKQGESLIPISETSLAVGDKIKVVVEINVDRNMEYVHLKDSRAAGLEPLDVLSGYHYAHGLGYYQSIRDASMNFFIDYLPKGVYRFEYGLRVFNKGDFSNGISSIQCMYAPEFASHSEGIRISVK